MGTCRLAVLQLPSEAANQGSVTKKPKEKTQNSSSDLRFGKLRLYLGGCNEEEKKAAAEDYLRPSYLLLPRLFLIYIHSTYLVQRSKVACISTNTICSGIPVGG